MGLIVSLTCLPISISAQDDLIGGDNNDDTADIDTQSTVDEDTSSTGFALGGDARPLVNYRDLNGRDGVSETDTDVRARLRLKGSFAIGESLRLGARLAGRYTSSNSDLEWFFEPSIPGSNGLEDGQTTLDELYAHFYKTDRLDITVGRQQTRFVLRSGVFARSLDRNDSNNINVTWTDGMRSDRVATGRHHGAVGGRNRQRRQ